MKLLKITDEMKTLAKQYADRVASHFTAQDRNYTGLSFDDRWYIGYLGELVFREYVDFLGVDYKYSLKTDGKADDSEFVVCGKTCDVKTAGKAFHTRIMLPKAQIARHKSDYYIGVKINGDSGEIHGYCTLADFKTGDFGYGIDTLYKELSELSPIDEILGLDNGE